jgi:hypothetical protein
VLLPRRGFAPALGRLLHDRTADKIAAVVSRLPNAAATIVPFDTSRRYSQTLENGGGYQLTKRAPTTNGSHPTVVNGSPPKVSAVDDLNRVLADDLAPGRNAIGGLGSRQQAVVHGRIRSVRMQPLADSPMLVCEVVDSTGGLELLFYGRRSIPGMVTGATVTATGGR